MARFGGMSPFPRRFGGGTPRAKIILESLNADCGDALDATNPDSIVYVENMAIARAIASAWSTNARLGNIWQPLRMSEEIVQRWERILALTPGEDDLLTTRRQRIADIFARFGKPTVAGRIEDLLAPALGDVFVAVEYIAYASARVVVPDGTYSIGVVGTVPWTSTVSHILVRLQKPADMTEGEFYDAAGRVYELCDPILPAWAAIDWYRAGSNYSAAGGLSRPGFYVAADLNGDGLHDSLFTAYTNSQLGNAILGG